MPGLRIERRLPPPVYRPGSPAVSAKIGGPPVRPVIVQRALDEYALARTQYDTNLTAALIEYGRTISAGNVRLVVTAHPPDDRYLVESTDNYIARVRDHLDPHDYKGRPKEKALINAALEQYRDELRAAAQRAEEQRRASLVILAEFERQASTRPQTKKIKEHMFSAEVDGSVPKGLHAYTNSALPGGTIVLATLGNVNEVHVLVWTKAGAEGKCKFSTMFPKDMPVGMVCWYLLHKRVAGTYTTAARPLVPPYVWKDITMGQSGDTNFPEYNATEAEIRNSIKASFDSYRTTVVKSVTNLFLTKGSKEYLLVN